MPRSRLLAVQPFDMQRWVVVEVDADVLSLPEILADLGLDLPTRRILALRDRATRLEDVLVHSEDTASPIMPEGWHFDDITRCWRFSDREPSFAGERWVRIMCDYYADGVWDRDGVSDVADSLPITTDLVARIRAWQDVYNAHDDDAGPFLDLDAFAAEGLAIAQAVKAELPDWTVIYFDESRMGGGRPRSAYEYEITQPGPDPA